MKEKIDLEKFICSYIKWNNIQDALKDQGLKCCNGKIVKISQENEDKQKFCEGDWIISKYMHLVMQVLDNDNGFYKTFETDGTERNDSYDFIERNFKLWTIADAKPGDVLLSQHNQPFIYNGIFDEESVGAYCGIDKFGNDFLIDTFSCDWSYKEGVKPATKEQRDTLFAKMKKAGWEWDTEKKKLKRINVELTDFEKSLKHIMIETLECGDTRNLKADAEMLLRLAQKPIEWSEKDDAYKLFAISAVEDYYDEKNPLQKDLVDWLKSIKNRVQPQLQSAWSEEDEVKINRIVDCLENLNVADNDILLKDVDWLKSLRPQNNITDEELAQAKKDAYNDALDKIEYHSGEPTFDDGWSAAIWYLKKKNAMPQTQWKPSDEQIISLRWVLNNIPYNKYKEEISGLLDQIKDL